MPNEKKRESHHALHSDHPHRDIGKVSSLGIPMNLPVDEFVGQSTEAHYQKKILDPIREKVLTWLESAKKLKGDPGRFYPSYQYEGRIEICKKVLDLIDPPETPAVPDPDKGQG